MVPAALAVGAAAATKVTAAGLGVAAAEGAAGFVGYEVAKRAAGLILPRAAASVGLGAAAAAAAPWVLGAMTVWQIGKFIFDYDKK